MAFQPELVSTYKLVYDLYRLELSDRGEEATVEPITAAVEAVLDELADDPAWIYRDTERRRQRVKVRQYVMNPHSYDPYLDPVALERALDFDWPVIASLTEYEKWAFTRQLAAMEDPFGFLEDGLTIGGKGASFPTYFATGRPARFLAGPREEQVNLRNRVLRLRDHAGPVLIAIEAVELGLAA